MPPVPLEALTPGLGLCPSELQEEPEERLIRQEELEELVTSRPGYSQLQALRVVWEEHPLPTPQPEGWAMAEVVEHRWPTADRAVR